MATQATLEQWEELYDLAIEITKLKPWNAYWDMDLIAVETKKNEEPNFVSIMGKGGTCTGISVYRGMEGYSDFCQISNDDYNVPATFVMSDQNCITCYWGNRDEVDDDMYSIIKQLGLRFRGNGNWIYFKTFEKKSFPSLPNYGEVKMLIETYKGLIETLKHEEYQESIFDKGDIIYTQKDEDNHWFSYTVPRPMEPERYNTILINDTNLIDHFKNMDDSDLELAIDMDYMMVPTNDKGFERPINPLAYIVFDLRNDQILHFDLIHPDQEDYEVIMNNFLGVIEHFGKPKHVYARNPYILNWLDFICEKLDIPLVEDDLEEIDDIFNMLKHMDME